MGFEIDECVFDLDIGLQGRLPDVVLLLEDSIDNEILTAGLVVLSVKLNMHCGFLNSLVREAMCIRVDFLFSFKIIIILSFMSFLQRGNTMQRVIELGKALLYLKPLSRRQERTY